MSAIARHWDIVREALADEKAKNRRMWDAEATSFLPAAMEITERPVSPTARWSARILLIGLVVTALWLVLGQIDIVASAPGKLIPADNVKIIQSAEAGVVRAINVRDGQSVRKGQVLVELDPTVSTAEALQAQKGLEVAELDAARARAIWSALNGNGLALRVPPGTSTSVYATQLALANSQLTEITAGDATRSADVNIARSSRSEALIQAAKLSETLPLIDEQIEANEKLLAKGFVSKLKVIEMRRQRLVALRDRDSAMETARKASAQIVSTRGSGEQGGADARTKVLMDLAKAEADVKLRREEMTKARQRSSLQQLRSPVDGTVSQLTVHTIGGVVEAAKPIMVLVPTGDRLELEVKVLNRDIGYLAKGQDVSIKLEAYPFTRYGTIPGQVVAIGSDAVADEDLGLVYTSRIRLAKNWINRDGTRVNLGAGLAATADIKTGRRSIISFIISPIDRARREAGHER